MTRYLPLIANLLGALLMFMGSVAVVTLAFVHDPLLGWSAVAAGAVVGGRQLANVGATQGEV